MLPDRSANPPRDAVLIDDAGIPVPVGLVFRLGFRARAGAKGTGVGPVDVVHPQIEGPRAGPPGSSRLSEHDERVADLDFRMHHGVVGIPLTTGFRGAEG